MATELEDHPIDVETFIEITKCFMKDASDQDAQNFSKLFPEWITRPESLCTALHILKESDDTAHVSLAALTIKNHIIWVREYDTLDVNLELIVSLLRRICRDDITKLQKVPSVFVCAADLLILDNFLIQNDSIVQILVNMDNEKLMKFFYTFLIEINSSDFYAYKTTEELESIRDEILPYILKVLSTSCVTEDTLGIFEHLLMTSSIPVEMIETMYHDLLQQINITQFVWKYPSLISSLSNYITENHTVVQRENIMQFVDFSVHVCRVMMDLFEYHQVAVIWSCIFKMTPSLLSDSSCTSQINVLIDSFLDCVNVLHYSNFSSQDLFYRCVDTVLQCNYDSTSYIQVVERLFTAALKVEIDFLPYLSRNLLSSFKSIVPDKFDLHVEQCMAKPGPLMYFAIAESSFRDNTECVTKLNEKILKSNQLSYSSFYFIKIYHQYIMYSVDRWLFLINREIELDNSFAFSHLEVFVTHINSLILNYEFDYVSVNTARFHASLFRSCQPLRRLMAGCIGNDIQNAVFMKNEGCLKEFVLIIEEILNNVTDIEIQTHIIALIYESYANETEITDEKQRLYDRLFKSLASNVQDEELSKHVIELLNLMMKTCPQPNHVRYCTENSILLPEELQEIITQNSPDEYPEFSMEFVDYRYAFDSFTSEFSLQFAKECISSNTNAVVQCALSKLRETLSSDHTESHPAHLFQEISQKALEGIITTYNVESTILAVDLLRLTNMKWNTWIQLKPSVPPDLFETLNFLIEESDLTTKTQYARLEKIRCWKAGSFLKTHV